MWHSIFLKRQAWRVPHHPTPLLLLDAVGLIVIIYFLQALRSASELQSRSLAGFVLAWSVREPLPIFRVTQLLGALHITLVSILITYRHVHCRTEVNLSYTTYAEPRDALVLAPP